MRIKIKLLLASLTAFFIFLVFTNPETLPSVILVVPFLLLFTVFTLLFEIILDKITRRKSMAVVLLLSGFLIIMLALQTLGQLTLRDIIMVTALFSVAFLYIYRRSVITG